LTVQQINRSGLTPTYSGVNADGHALPNAGQEFVHIKTGGTSCTVTVHTPGTVDGQTIADRTIVIGTNAERFIGPFPPAVYNQIGGGDVYLDFTASTSVIIAAFRAT
jgi:hypothetical protein